MKDLRRSIINRNNLSNGGTRQHAEAMLIEDLRKVFAWSVSECSESMAARAAVGNDGAVLVKVARHLEFRAAVSLGFVLFLLFTVHDCIDFLRFYPMSGTIWRPPFIPITDRTMCGHSLDVYSRILACLALGCSVVSSLPSSGLENSVMHISGERQELACS